jgi:hypothetical protein
MHLAAQPRPLEGAVLWFCSACDGACVQQRWVGVLMLTAGAVLAVGGIFGSL